MEPDSQGLFGRRLSRNVRLLGTILSLPSPEIAEICADAGFDWLFIDMEHGLLDGEAVQRMIQAVAERCPCIVRVPANDPVWIGRILDTGASGLILPHINGPSEAAAAVKAAKYPPQGDRGVGPARANRYGARVLETLERANTAAVLIAQAEHIDAVRRIEEIIAVPGVDAILIGPFDLSASMGKPGRFDDAEVQGAISTIFGACRSRGKPCGIFVISAAAARKAFEEGYSFVCASTDTLLLGSAARDLTANSKP